MNELILVLKIEPISVDISVKEDEGLPRRRATYMKCHLDESPPRWMFA
jgi:hypothetical protein